MSRYASIGSENIAAESYMESFVLIGSEAIPFNATHFCALKTNMQIIVKPFK